jgi:hypothetical protein
MPLAEALHAALETYPYYPGYPTNDETPGNMFPIHSQKLRRASLCCQCSSTPRSTTRSVIVPLTTYAVRTVSWDVHHKGCGIIPVPLPSLYPPRYMRWRGMAPHMVVVPPEEDEDQVEAGQPAHEPVPKPSATHNLQTSPRAAPETARGVPWYFGVPTNEVGHSRGILLNQDLNNDLTGDFAAGNPNTNAYVYESEVAPVQPLTVNASMGANTADTQPGIQNGLTRQLFFLNLVLLSGSSYRFAFLIFLSFDLKY